jgi:hypothetical protein
MAQSLRILGFCLVLGHKLRVLDTATLRSLIWVELLVAWVHIL